MLRYKRTIQIVILAAVLVIAAFTLIGGLLDKKEIPGVGSQAPDFTLNTMSGEEQTLSALRGQVVIVNFWGTYCPPCVREMPLIQSYYEKYKDQGVIVLAVNEGDPLVTIKAFVRQYGLTFPVLLDPDTVRKQYGVTAYPHTFFLDRQGTIVAEAPGEMNDAFLAGALAKAMGK